MNSKFFLGVLFVLMVSQEGLSVDSTHPFETKMLKLIEEVSPNKKFLLYTLAGREFYERKILDYSQKYYAKAIQIETNYPKTEAYLKLLRMAHLKRDEESLKYWLKELKIYFKKNPLLQNTIINNHLHYYEIGSSNKLISEAIGRKAPATFRQSPLYRDLVIHHDTKILIQRGLFQKALDILERSHQDRLPIDEVVLSDLLRLLTQKETKLVCKKRLERFPSSYSYTAILCENLSHYLKTGRLSSQKTEDLKKFLLQHYPEKYFLYLTLLNLDKKMLPNKNIEYNPF